MGERQRYRLLAGEGLLRALGGMDLREFQAQYAHDMQAAIERRHLQRQGCWTENLAVGSERFVQQMQQRMQFRQRLELASVELGDGEMVWTLKEAPAAYERCRGLEMHPKTYRRQEKAHNRLRPNFLPWAAPTPTRIA